MEICFSLPVSVPNTCDISGITVFKEIQENCNLARPLPLTEPNIVWVEEHKHFFKYLNMIKIFPFLIIILQITNTPKYRIEFIPIQTM